MVFVRPIPSDREDPPMDDYQEELLEYRAFEQDPAEPAEDATEL